MVYNNTYYISKNLTIITFVLVNTERIISYNIKNNDIQNISYFITLYIKKNLVGTYSIKSKTGFETHIIYAYIYINNLNPINRK